MRVFSLVGFAKVNGTVRIWHLVRVLCSSEWRSWTPKTVGDDAKLQCGFVHEFRLHIVCFLCALGVCHSYSKIWAMMLIFLYDWNHLYRFDVEMFFLSALTGKGVSLHGAYCISFARKLLQIWNGALQVNSFVQISFKSKFTWHQLGKWFYGRGFLGHVSSTVSPWRVDPPIKITCATHALLIAQCHK